MFKIFLFFSDNKGYYLEVGGHLSGTIYCKNVLDWKSQFQHLNIHVLHINLMWKYLLYIGYFMLMIENITWTLNYLWGQWRNDNIWQGTESKFIITRITNSYKFLINLFMNIVDRLVPEFSVYLYIPQSLICYDSFSQTVTYFFIQI